MSTCLSPVDDYEPVDTVVITDTLQPTQENPKFATSRSLLLKLAEMNRRIMKWQEAPLTVLQREHRKVNSMFCATGMVAYLPAAFCYTRVQGCHHIVMLSTAFSSFVLRCVIVTTDCFFGGWKTFQQRSSSSFLSFFAFYFFFLLFFRVILFDRSSQRRTLLSPLLMNRSFTEDSLPPSLNINHLFMRFRYKSSVLASTLPILKSRTPSPPRLSSQTHKIKSHPL